MNSQIFCFTVLLALVACVYTQLCFRRDGCGEESCCRRTFRYIIPGLCTDRMLGSLCGGQFDCNCLEGECRWGRCRETSTTTTGSTEGPTTTSMSSEPTTQSTTMQPESTQATETTAV